MAGIIRAGPAVGRRSAKLGSYSLWCNSESGAIEAVPRHTEVSNLLARKICRNLSVPEIGQKK